MEQEEIKKLDYVIPKIDLFNIYNYYFFVLPF